MVTNRENVIETLSHILFYRLRTASGNVDSDFSHGLDRIWIESCRTSARAENLEAISRHVTQQTFRHLAASRVARA